MAEALSLGARAFDHIRVLVEKIGPRPAGSPAEALARQYIIDQLAAWGYQAERQAAPFAPLPAFFKLYPLAGLLFVLAGWGVNAVPWLTLWLPLLLLALPALSRWLVQRRTLRAKSENIIAYSPGAPEDFTLILAAHVDSARAGAFKGRAWRWLYARTADIAQRVALLVCGLSLLRLLGLPLPGFALLFAGIPASLVGGWIIFSELMNQFAHGGRYSPGAQDNASGVGVVLALAEHFAAHPTGHLRLGFLFTGAEETGMHGAEAFAIQCKQTNRPVAVLNLDMVGAGGELCVIHRDGTLFSLRTDPRLNRRLLDANPDARLLWSTLRSGDYAPFVRRGIPAAGLQTAGSLRAELAYHTQFDTLDLIECPVLEATAQTVLRLIEGMDKPDPGISLSG
jgi:hypothetical protein